MISRKTLALIGALIMGGIGIATVGIGTHAVHAGVQFNWRSEKTVAIIGALIAGGLGIAAVSLRPQIAHAGINFN